MMQLWLRITTVYKIIETNKYKRDYRLAVRQGKDIQHLNAVIDFLAAGGTLAEEYRDHSLKGDYKGYRECHLTPDWLLIYKIMTIQSPHEVI